MKQKFKNTVLKKTKHAACLATVLVSLTMLPAKQSSASCSSCILGHETLHETTRDWVTDGFLSHQGWLVDVFFEEYILPAFMMMTEQLTVAMMFQTSLIGQFLDAKHQLETQRLMQQLQAEAHNNYQPDEELCKIGTNLRSLGASKRLAELNRTAFANRIMQRELKSGDVVSLYGESSDRISRLEQYKTTFCNPLDNGMGLELLCGAGGPPEQQNKDVSVYETLYAPSTEHVDFTEAGGGPPTPAEERMFALSANLIGHSTPSQIPESFLTDAEGDHYETAVSAFLSGRSKTARRSIVAYSFAGQASQVGWGGEEVRPWMGAMMQDTGLPDPEIAETLDERPSPKALREAFKANFQNPNFIKSTYGSEANVERQEAMMQQFILSEKWEQLQSSFNTEFLLGAALATKASAEMARVRNEVDQLGQDGVSN